MKKEELTRKYEELTLRRKTEEEKRKSNVIFCQQRLGQIKKEDPEFFMEMITLQEEKIYDELVNKFFKERKRELTKEDWIKLSVDLDTLERINRIKMI